MDDRTEAQNSAIFASRLIVGLLQGLALYFLYVAFEDRTWPSNNGLIFAPLLFLASFTLLVLIFGIGNLRIVTLALWTVLAAAIVAGLAWYDIWHDPGTAFQYIRPGHWGEAPRILPSFAACFFTSAFMFIAQALIAGGDHDRRFVAHYATHFDVAWKLGLQLVLSVLFVGVFWGVLHLGAELFHIIGIDYFQKLIEHRWFSIPATTLAQAAALHLTDVRASLVRGMRTVVLVLLSWLLPLMTIIGAGFLASLLSTGLAPLWSTRFAAGYLLISAGILVFLINAAYQDGDAERRPHVILRYAGSLASVLLLPLVALSAYAIYLRVREYGWTTDRVASTAVLAAAACYAVGYALAAIPSGAWLARIAGWNFFTAILVLALIGAIFSSAADPVRISVDSQVARVLGGKIEPAKFDFAWLRWNGGRFGKEALQRLARLNGNGRVAEIARRARAVLADKSRYRFGPIEPTADMLAANITVYPHGRTLPQSFLKQDWSNVRGRLPFCLRNVNFHCNAYFVKLGSDGREQIVILGNGSSGFVQSFENALFAQQPDGRWALAGQPGPEWNCREAVAALQSGQFKVVPAAPRFHDIEAGGRRLTIDEPDAFASSCPD